jgi:hypothetical protein
MADPTGESTGAALKLDFDRRLRLRFRGSVITSELGRPMLHRDRRSVSK